MNKIMFLKTYGTASIIDSFDRANSTDSLGNTNTWQTWENGSPLTGRLGIDNNAAYYASTGDGTAVVTCPSSNGTLTLVVGTYATWSGFVFRCTDSNNYCFMQYTTGKIYFDGKAGGASFGGPSVSGYFINTTTIADGDTVKLTMNGTSMSVYVNGSLVGTRTITQNASGTKHGLKITHPTSRINSFRFDL